MKRCSGTGWYARISWRKATHRAEPTSVNAAFAHEPAHERAAREEFGVCREISPAYEPV
jgi:hypothetical protein